MLLTEVWYRTASREPPPTLAATPATSGQSRPSIRRRVGKRLIVLGLALADEGR